MKSTAVHNYARGLHTSSPRTRRNLQSCQVHSQQLRYTDVPFFSCASCFHCTFSVYKQKYHRTVGYSIQDSNMLLAAQDLQAHLDAECVIPPWSVCTHSVMLPQQWNCPTVLCSEVSPSLRGVFSLSFSHWKGFETITSQLQWTLLVSDLGF